jgi:hypothetical protein
VDRLAAAALIDRQPTSSDIERYGLHPAVAATLRTTTPPEVLDAINRVGLTL